MREDGVATFYAKDSNAWRSWLEQNHTKEKSVWLIIYKKSSKTPSVTYDEAVDESLCFGWIDSKPNKRDAESYYQFFAKRNTKSNWSKVNKDKVRRLLKENRMRPAGLEMVAIAKKSGTWNALDEVENLVIPDDLGMHFQKYPDAAINFENFPKSVKRGILEWILNAKRPETRSKRIDETAKLAAANIRANQFNPKK
ncbi:MAG: YdeI/OmpD-associated family protein [Bacteroidota bacterium]